MATVRGRMLKQPRLTITTYNGVPMLRVDDSANHEFWLTVELTEGNVRDLLLMWYTNDRDAVMRALYDVLRMERVRPRELPGTAPSIKCPMCGAEVEVSPPCPDGSVLMRCPICSSSGRVLG